jgi:DNA-binding IclR family transcriptional regulator
MPSSTVAAAKSPPTRRTMNVLTALAESGGQTSAELARRCGITTSTCALVLAELERDGWVARDDQRRYRLGSGLFGLVHGLRRQFALLDRGRDALTLLHDRLGAGCSMSRIDERHLTTVDSVGHGTDAEHAVGQRFPIDPPFGLVAMAWRDDATVDGWLRAVTPRLTTADIDRYRGVLADVRARGYGAWRFDDEHDALHDRIATVLASLQPTERVTRQLSALLTMVTLRSVTDSLETQLHATEFVVLPIFGRSGQPEYQIEIHLGGSSKLTLAELDSVLTTVSQRLAP